ncbi:MAG: hypothetical protein HYS14_06590 [Candidatus Rokubacteria bacterium]|nr:hypothetical protein [Candidatus Rokubacteria bacterium]MBI3454450.1 hypothetical protein [Candidatus Rokubacteria bacterium]
MELRRILAELLRLGVIKAVEVVMVERLDLPRLTIDVDRTVVRTGNTVAWAFRGFNPHH